MSLHPLLTGYPEVFVVQIILIAIEDNIYFIRGNDMFNFDFCQIRQDNRQIKQAPV